jgi:trk system potassium uptake protein TrkA
VSREQYVPLVDALQIDAAFSLRLNTAEAIMRFARAQSVRTMHLLLCGAEALELQAEAGSAIVGRRVDGTGPLENSEIGAIVRDDRVLIPGPDDVIAAGDRVLLFRLPGQAEDAERSFDA